MIIFAMAWCKLLKIKHYVLQVMITFPGYFIILCVLFISLLISLFSFARFKKQLL